MFIERYKVIFLIRKLKLTKEEGSRKSLVHVYREFERLIPSTAGGRWRVLLLTVF